MRFHCPTSMKFWRRKMLPCAVMLGPLVLAGAAHAMEIVPSIGITRAVEGSDETKASLGLAMRSQLVPMVKCELGLSYRSEERYNGDLNVRTWPLTASVWLTPVPVVYAGGGVGWYVTTLDYRSTLAYTDESMQKFGVHLGGGVSLPLVPKISCELSGRYIFLEKQESQLTPEKFDPDFWSASLGLAVKF